MVSTPIKLSISPTARRDHSAFLWPGGPVGCLLVHGFTGSPAEVRDLGAYLHNQGYTVQGILLPGHGGDPDLMGTATHYHWLAAVETALRDMQARCSRIFIIGFSMGGSLTLEIAARHPELAGVVALSAAIRISQLRERWKIVVLPFAQLVMPWFYPLARANFKDPKVREIILRYAPDPPPDLDDPAVVARIRKIVKVSLRAAYGLQIASQRARRALPQVRQPILVIHGLLDETVPPDSSHEIMARVGSTDKKLVLLDKSHHVITEDVQAEEVFQAIGEFIASHTKDMIGAGSIAQRS